MRNFQGMVSVFPPVPMILISSLNFLGPEGLPIETLQVDFWVPGSQARADTAKYAGKSQFQEILVVTEEMAVLWATRAVQEMWGNGHTHESNILSVQFQRSWLISCCIQFSINPGCRISCGRLAQKLQSKPRTSRKHAMDNSNKSLSVLQYFLLFFI